MHRMQTFLILSKQNKLGFHFDIMADQDPEYLAKSYVIQPRIGVAQDSTAEYITSLGGDPESLSWDVQTRMILKNLYSQKLTTLVQCCKLDCSCQGRWFYLGKDVDVSRLPRQITCQSAALKGKITIEGFRPTFDRYERLEYSLGALVWAKLQGQCWWPAMVDLCPDNRCFTWSVNSSDDNLPSWYNVVFFGGKAVSRRWMKVEKMCPFVDLNPDEVLQMETSKTPRNLKVVMFICKNRADFQDSVNQAQDASWMLLKDRFDTFSFMARYEGQILPQPTKRKRSGSSNATKTARMVEDTAEPEPQTPQTEFAPKIAEVKSALIENLADKNPLEDDDVVMITGENSEPSNPWNKPPICAKVLVVLSVQNCEVNCQIDWFVREHFPYFLDKPKLTLKLVKTVLYGQGKQAPRVLTKAGLSLDYMELKRQFPVLLERCTSNREALRASMRYPYLLDSFLLHCQPVVPIYKRPPFHLSFIVDISIMTLQTFHPELKEFLAADLARLIKAFFPYYHAKKNYDLKREIREVSGFASCFTLTQDILSRSKPNSALLMARGSNEWVINDISLEILLRNCARLRQPPSENLKKWVTSSEYLFEQVLSKSKQKHRNSLMVDHNYTKL